MPVTVRKANRNDVTPLASTLAQAFQDDPVMRWLLPHPDTPLRRLPGMFAMELTCLYLPHDEVYTTRDLAGAAMWAPPGGWRTPPSSLLRAIPRLVWTLRGRTAAAVRCVAAIERMHPEEPHWYLSVVGTEPSRRHEGIGSALLAPVLARCDRDDIGAYLESSNKDNLVFYRHLGFEVTGSIDLPDGGPQVWPMWRPPRA
jgi:ribosomal protein S18 acetylase RimI-like enzyme